MSSIKKELQEQLARLCEEKIEPFLEQDDQQSIFRPEIYAALGEQGFTGVTTSEEYAGAGLTQNELIIVLEKLAESSVSYAVTISVSCMVQALLQNYGNEKQKKLYLPALAQGKEIGAFALTESNAGSDASQLKLKATKKDQGYLLHGNKIFTTSAGVAKTYIVMARTGKEGAAGISAFIVRDGTPGFSYGKPEKKMGWKSSPMRELVFENCFIPEENLLAEEGMGFKMALWALDRGRIGIGSISVGLARRAMREALKFSLQRQQFGQNINDFQGMQFLLADMYAELESCALLVEKAAQEMVAGKTFTHWAAIAKLKASDMAMKVTTDAVQVLGGVGFTSEYPLERYMRDAKGLQIAEGTNQIQRLVIARHLKNQGDV